MKRRPGYLTHWDGPTHPDAAGIVLEHDRTFQVWEDGEDDLIQFIIGPPEVTAWTADGKPFQFSHPVFSIDENGQPTDWPLIETVDRPLEVKNRARLA